jgi:hypothetical protein
VESALRSKGLNVSKDDLEVITNQWKAFIQLRGEVQKLELGECNMMLIHIPQGEWPHEE